MFDRFFLKIESVFIMRKFCYLSRPLSTATPQDDNKPIRIFYGLIAVHSRYVTFAFQRAYEAIVLVTYRSPIVFLVSAASQVLSTSSSAIGNNVE